MVIKRYKAKLHALCKIDRWSACLFAVAFVLLSSTMAHATDAADISRNITTSVETLPGLITAIAYLLAILFGVLGILKLKDHVENPSQTALRIPIIRFIIGGALFALPIIYNAMTIAINGGNFTNIDLAGGAINAVSALFGISGVIPLQNINQVLNNIIWSIDEIPGLLTAVAYLLGLLLGVLGLLKIKDHVENPDQNKLKDGVIRLLVGGAFFALPTVFEAMREAISASGGLGFTGILGSIIGGAGFLFSFEARTACVPGLINPNMGQILCNSILHTGSIPAFLAAISYLIGIVLGFWALIKIKDHVENPAQTKLSEPVSRLIAGGLFFSLPFVIETARNTIAPVTLVPHFNTGFNEPGSGGILSTVLGFFGLGGLAPASGAASTGLDGALFMFMQNLFGPITVVLNFFGYIAGTILIMIAIMRLIKSAQEGARGPAGLGTFMTFVAGGALISFNQLMTAMSMSLFNLPFTRTFATLKYVAGMSTTEQDHVNMIISAILKFMIVVGLISFVRGIFIIRDVAEGKQQASIMAGVTHMVGGSLAVNLGPVLNAVQSTLGIATYGIAFT